MKFTSIALAFLVSIASAIPQVANTCTPSTLTITRTATSTRTTTTTRLSTLTRTSISFSVRTVTATVTESAATAVVSQANVCGNGAMPFCCTSDGGMGYSECAAMGASSICSQTIVCCNANNSIQTCLGNANITN